MFNELNKRLNAECVEFFEGEVCKDQEGKTIKLEDNRTRMEATKLLAKIHGLEKNTVDHNLNVSSDTGVLRAPMEVSRDEWEERARKTRIITDGKTIKDA